MPGLNNLILIFNEMEKLYLKKCPWAAIVIKDIFNKIRSATEKLIHERR